MQDRQPGWTLDGRYRIVGRVGTGGMAEVFRAHDDVLDRDVAVKVFRSLPATPDTALGSTRQQRELQALATLNHPNLITLYDGTIGNGSTEPAHLVMELVDGPNLAERIAQGPIPEPVVRRIGIQIADALSYVHARNMVHRDVKPANILLGESEDGSVPRARLSDFGIVQFLGAERLTTVDMTVGSASYLAPEQARGGEVGPPADVYALGLVLLEALTLTRAYDGTPLEAMSARLHRPPEIPADLAQPWVPLLTAMTALDPAQRPTVREVGDTLRGATVSHPIPPPLVAGDDATTDEQRRHRAIPVLVAALVVGVLAIGLAALSASPATNGTPTGPAPGLARHSTTKGAPSRAAVVARDPSTPRASHAPSSAASTARSTHPPSSNPATTPATSQPVSSTPPSSPVTTESTPATSPAGTPATSPAGSSGASLTAPTTAAS